MKGLELRCRHAMTSQKHCDLLLIKRGHVQFRQPLGAGRPSAWPQAEGVREVGDVLQ